jgi:hypothetical protein
MHRASPRSAPTPRRAAEPGLPARVPVRFLGAMVVPEEEVCIYLYWAPSVSDEEFGLYLWTSCTTGAGAARSPRSARTGSTSPAGRSASPPITSSSRATGSRTAQDRRRPPAVPGPAYLRAVRRAVPMPPLRDRGPRRPGAGRCLRFSPGPGRPHAVEPRHDDPPVPPLRLPGRHRQFARSRSCGTTPPPSFWKLAPTSIPSPGG